MNRRLLLSYVGLVLLVLVVLEVPLAVYYSRNERNALADKVERDAVALGSVAEGAFEQPPEVPPSRLQGLAVRYSRQTGGRVVIVTYPRGIAVADSAGSPGASFASRPEIRRALSGHVAQGVRYSHTLGTNLLYVAVPVASAGRLHGAVRITYPTSTVDARTHRYWLILARDRRDRLRSCSPPRADDGAVDLQATARSRGGRSRRWRGRSVSARACGGGAARGALTRTLDQRDRGASSSSCSSRKRPSSRTPPTSCGRR